MATSAGANAGAARAPAPRAEAVRPKRGLAPSGHRVLQLQERRPQGTLVVVPSDCFRLEFSSQARLEEDRAPVRVEDDLSFASFAHGPPGGCIRNCQGLEREFSPTLPKHKRPVAGDRPPRRRGRRHDRPEAPSRSREPLPFSFAHNGNRSCAPTSGCSASSTGRLN
jgi:hypothetical protein